MTDEDKMQVQLTRGNAAKQELVTLSTAFERVKQLYVDAWMKSDARDNQGREKLWVATTIVTQVERQLRQFVADGKVAERELEKIRNAGTRPSFVHTLLPQPLRNYD